MIYMYRYVIACADYVSEAVDTNISVWDKLHKIRGIVKINLL